MSTDPNEDKSEPSENIEKDDAAQRDLEESLGGVDNSKYQHVIESETVAELEEIFFSEKKNIELNSMVDSDVKSRDVTSEEAKVLPKLVLITQVKV